MKCKHWDGCLKFNKSESGCPIKECFETVESPETPQADVALNDLLNAVAEIRKQDCGGWMVDCTASHCCAAGRKKRTELMRLLEKLYKAAGI